MQQSHDLFANGFNAGQAISPSWKHLHQTRLLV